MHRYEIRYDRRISNIYTVLKMLALCINKHSGKAAFIKYSLLKQDIDELYFHEHINVSCTDDYSVKFFIRTQNVKMC